MSGLFTGHEAIDRALEPVRAAFARALGDGRELTVADTPLRVDQVRGIAAMPGNDDAWSERGGKRLVRNDTLLGRSVLGYVVGAGRYLSGHDFERILTGILRGDLSEERETDVAQFVNLIAAERRHDPRTEPLIWASVARRLAEGRGEASFSQEIPGLLTAFDPLHEEIPPGAQLAEGLRPAAARPLEPTVERYRERLRAELGGDLGAYVRAHLLSRLGRGPS